MVALGQCKHTALCRAQGPNRAHTLSRLRASLTPAGWIQRLSLKICSPALDQPYSDELHSSLRSVPADRSLPHPSSAPRHYPAEAGATGIVCTQPELQPELHPHPVTWRLSPHPGSRPLFSVQGSARAELG